MHFSSDRPGWTGSSMEHTDASVYISECGAVYRCGDAVYTGTSQTSE